MSSTVVAFGEALWDLLPTGPVLGGAPLNFAYRVHSLGHPSIIVSRLGKDDFGAKGPRTDHQLLQWTTPASSATTPIPPEP